MPKQKPKQIKRDRLFHDQFEWSLSFRVKDAWLARCLDHQRLDGWILHRQSLATRWSSSTKDIITAQDQANLHELINILGALPSPHRFYFSWHWVYVYHNDLAQLEQLAQCSFMSQQRLSQAVVDRPRDVVVKQNPKYGYRTYLRERMFRDMDQGRSFRDFLRRQDHWNLSGSLGRAIDNSKFFYVQRYHFVEHDNPQDALLLNLHTPNIVRKTLPVRAK